MPVANVEALIHNRVQAIRQFHNRTGISNAQLDVSGGIDSAVMLALLSLAIGSDKITAVYSSIHSSQDSKERAIAAAKAFSIPLIQLELSQQFDELQSYLIHAAEQAGFSRPEIEERIQNDATVLGSFRSCFRAPLGRALNRMTGGGIRHGTGNECEDRWLRFFQKGGDGEVDSNPIAMLSKGEVYQLARALDVPKRLIEALPSPDLHGTGESHNDEDELKASSGVEWTYSRIDSESGNYRVVGTIERMSRFLDLPESSPLLGASVPSDSEMKQMVRAAEGIFSGFSSGQIQDFLKSCRKIEATSRHKHNPNCPSLGSREDLVHAQILSNQLPL